MPVTAQWVAEGRSGAPTLTFSSLHCISASPHILRVWHPWPPWWPSTGLAQACQCPSCAGKPKLGTALKLWSDRYQTGKSLPWTCWVCCPTSAVQSAVIPLPVIPLHWRPDDSLCTQLPGLQSHLSSTQLLAWDWSVQAQGFPVDFVELHEAALSPFLQPVETLLSGSPTFQLTNPSSQFYVICKLAGAWDLPCLSLLCHPWSSTKTRRVVWWRGVAFLLG